MIAVSAFYIGWKKGQKEKETELTGAEPCIINVAGEDKKVPQSVCDIISRGQSLLGGSPGVL